jgi:serine/threonine-protein kinase HipA
MRQLKMSPEAFEQAFRRIAFNVMATNCDDHTKNFSFILREQRHWELAPAYDLIYAYNPKGEWTYQHLMSVNGKFDQVRRDDLLVLADRFQIAAASRALADVRAAVASWPEFAGKARVSNQSAERIHHHHMLL